MVVRVDLGGRSVRGLDSSLRVSKGSNRLVPRSVDGRRPGALQKYKVDGNPVTKYVVQDVNST